MGISLAILFIALSCIAAYMRENSVTCLYPEPINALFAMVIVVGNILAVAKIILWCIDHVTII
jgi:hypothetical protein